MKVALYYCAAVATFTFSHAGLQFANENHRWHSQEAISKMVFLFLLPKETKIRSAARIPKSIFAKASGQHAASSTQKRRRKDLQRSHFPIFTNISPFCLQLLRLAGFFWWLLIRLLALFGPNWAWNWKEKYLPIEWRGDMFKPDLKIDLPRLSEIALNIQRNAQNLFAWDFFHFRSWQRAISSFYPKLLPMISIFSVW